MNSVVIWKDAILLHWDGVLPPGAAPNSVREPDDVVYFWEHLKGFTRWSKRTQSFVLQFSKQNLKRIHAQFGQIPVKGGMDRITDLKSKQEQFVQMVGTAMQCKTGEGLPAYDYKVPPLADYQHRAVVYVSNVKRAPLFLDCGMGKTFIVLNSIARHIEKGVVPSGKTLICAKLATIETGWLEDAEKFTGLKLISLWLPQKGGAAKRKAAILERLNTPADAYVINHDGLRIFKDELAEKKFQKVVLDESTILKNFHGMSMKIKGGQFGRALVEVAAHADWRVLMTGTPAPNGPQDLWGQMYFLDPEGLALEPTFNDFREEYMSVIDLRPEARRFRTTENGDRFYLPMRGDTPKKWIPKKDAIERIGTIINPWAFRARIRDHIKDLPELTVMKRKIEMSAEQRMHYEDMKERLRVVIDDTRITVPVKIAQLMKLRQISGGFIIDNAEVAHPIADNPKVAELDSLLEEIGDEKVVIYGQYQWEIKMLEERYKDRGAVTVYGGNSSQVNLANIKRFREDAACRTIILHPKSAAHGITFTVAHYMVFFSFDHSAEDNYQCVKRIERAGQKNAMLVYYLLCRESVDEAIYETILRKNQNQQQLIDQDQMLINIWRGKK
jgi:SNF2 family DNA or RNA helicase